MCCLILVLSDLGALILSCLVVIRYKPFSMKGVFCTKDVTKGIDGSAGAVLSMLKSAFAGCDVYCLDQVHSDRIVFSEEIPDGIIPQADAVISQDVDAILCIRTADCVPVLAWAEDMPLIAAIHAGWRGLALDIVGKCILTMRSLGGRDIRASIGPAIGRCCYEVKMDVVEALCTEPIYTREGRLVADLWKVASSQLMQGGVDPLSIEIKGLCTFCNTDMFFSYRRQGAQAGRNISLIGGRSWSLPGLQVG